MSNIHTHTWPQGMSVCMARGCLLGHGAAAGFLAGVVFIAFQSLMSLLLYGRFFSPLRMISAILLGADALDQWYSLFAAAIIGVLLLILFSTAFGMLFGAIIHRTPRLAATPWRLVFAAGVYGFFLWIFNWYMISPLFGWYWFVSRTHPLLQGFIGYTVFFGMVLGGLMVYRQIKTAGAAPANM